MSNVSPSWWRIFASLFERRACIPLHSGCQELDNEIAAVRATKQHTHNHRRRDPRRLFTFRVRGGRTTDVLFECQCCFEELPWDSMCYCPDWHYFCRRCLQQSVEGSIFGRGNSTIDYIKGSVKCLSSTANPPCISSISPQSLPRFLAPDILSRLEDHLAKTALDKSGISAAISCCPFCRFAVENVEPADRSFVDRESVGQLLDMFFDTDNSMLGEFALGKPLILPNSSG